MSRLPLLSLVIIAGCGPSLREVHQGDVFYERCYAAEHDGSVNDQERERCWTGWLAEYRLGQSTARIRHAESRVAGLQRGDSVAALPGIGESPAEAALRRQAGRVEQETPPDATGGESDEPNTRQPEPGTERETSGETPAEETAPPEDGTDVGETSDESVTEVAAEPESETDVDTTSAPTRATERIRSERTPPVITSHNRSCEPGCRPRWQTCADRCEETPCYQSCDAEYRVCMRACIF